MTATELDELTSVVLAPNPSPMTLEGTNTYVIGRRAAGEVVVVDPGPDRPAHRAAIDAEVKRRDAAVVAVVVTHHHRDHAEAAGWAAVWGAELFAFAPQLLSVPATGLADDTGIRRGGTTLQAVHTPGHASDHLCLRLVDNGAVLTGDHVLGRGTTVVAWPDGDMAAYLQSLRRLAALDPAVLYPGHGPVLSDPAAAVAAYLGHRQQRETEILAALRAGDHTAAAIVARVYAGVDPVLHPAAERSVRAHLAKLVEEQRVVRLVDPALDRETYRVL